MEVSGRLREQRRLVIGGGRFVADVPAPDMLHLAVVRSPHASARILRVDGRAAGRMRGVVDVVAFADLGALPGPIPLYRPHARLRARTPYPLANGRVRYVGEPVAAVLASDPARAADAADAVVVGYEPERSVTDPVEALGAGAPLVHPELGSNLAAEVADRVGDPAAAFARADHVARVSLRIGRQSPQPLECRAVLAAWDAAEPLLTVWDASQSAPLVRRMLAYLLSLPARHVRVVVRDVGGAFGGKNRFYPEEFLVAFLAMRHGRPVRWLGTRREDLLAMYQEREQVQEGELALGRDGTILGLRVRYVDAAGAYTPFGIVSSHMTAMKATGPYRIRDYEFQYRVAYTHKPGLAPYRGAGQPQGAFLIERLVDRAARDLGLDPAALRLRNMITASEQPWDTELRRDGVSLVFDGGDYPRAFRRVLDLIDDAAIGSRRQTARREGRRLGVGAGFALEAASTGTTEEARVAVDADGAVTVWSAGSNIGQGLEASLARVCGEHLGVPAGRVTVVLGDTSATPNGGGSFASRSAVAAGNAVALAARRVRDKALAIAAHFLEASPDDLEVRDGGVQVRGMPGRAVPFGALASAVVYPNFSERWRWPTHQPYPWGEEPGLEAAAAFRPTFTFSYGAHAAVVDVDPETGVVRIVAYAVVHDCGRVIDPAIIAGQVVGAVAQGIGGALFEEIVHDDIGQPLTSTFMDYAMPRALDIPAIALDHFETPAPNPLGVKGAGEGGIIPVASVVAAAIDDALDHRIFCDRTPITAERLWRALRASGAVR